MTRKLSPALLERIDHLSGCRGRWIVDCRAIEGDSSYALRSLGDSFLMPTPDGERYWKATPAGDASPYRIGSPEDAALYCAHTGWQARLLWCSDLLREDCSWPGGYEPSAVYRSNARVFRDQFAKELILADGDADDVSLDVRYVTAEMLETFAGLENYILLDEEDHSDLEADDQQEAWENWAAADWRRLVCRALDAVLPEDATADADDLLDAIPDADSCLFDLFRACADQAGEYWFEDGDSGQYIRLERVAESLDLADLRELTGLQLLSPDQHWRTEPYPWPDGSTDPLLPALA